MIYKPFKEITLPALGMGAMRPSVGNITGKDIIDCVISNGINYFDTAYVYGKDGDSEKVLGEFLPNYPRESYYLSTKHINYAGEDYKAIFEEQLIRLKTDYIDFYMIHGIGDDSYQKYIDNGCIEYFAEEQKKGRIKYFGFSSHASVETLKTWVDYLQWDFGLIQLNFYDWLYGSAKQEYEFLITRQIPIIVMEPIRGGRLASLSPKAEAILKETRPDWSIASWAFRWLKRLPNIQMVLSGMTSLEQIKENNILFSVDSNDFNDEDEKKLFEACEAFRKEVSVLCTECRYCLNDCPAEIDIPKMIEVYNYNKINKPWEPKKTDKVESKGKPADCTECGICLTRCPQKIDIKAIMKELSV
jgi:predicted aldo/keto reductase-like oxidoreductase